MDLIERARKYVLKMPPAVSGGGGHNATFHVACILVQGFGLSPEQAWPLMQEFNALCAPPWSEKDLRYKLRGADKQNSARGRGWLAKGAEWTPSKEWNGYHRVDEVKKAVFESDKLAKFSGQWARVVDLVWLANRSAVDPATVTAEQFLECVFRPGEKVAIFTEYYSSTIGRGLVMWPGCEVPTRGPERRPCGVWYLSQPVDGDYHAHDDETKPMTPRNWRAVTDWRHLVIESDEANTRQWLGALAQLPLRLVALYTSGGRSVHALVRVDARSKADWDAERDKIKTPLTVLGADPKTLTAVRLTRLPGCWRHGKMVDRPAADGKKQKRFEPFAQPKFQKLLYLNPNPPLAPLVDIFARRDVVKHWTDLAAAGVADTDETGGEWIDRGLDYYAGVNADCYAALQEFRGENQ